MAEDVSGRHLPKGQTTGPSCPRPWAPPKC